MARRLRGIRGRAWGNALGGWRRQARDARGRFASGRSGGSRKSIQRRTGNAGRALNRQPNATRGRKGYRKKTTAEKMFNTAVGTSRAARSGDFHRRLGAKQSHGKNLPLNSVGRYTDRQYNSAWTKAGTYRYDRAKTTKSIQKAHVQNIVTLKTGEYGGYAIGATAAAGLGPFMAPLVGQATGAAGKWAAGRSLKQEGIYIGPKQFLAMNQHDQAAIVQRHNRVEVVDTAVNIGMTVYSIHSALRAGNSYGRLADRIAGRKAGNMRASTHGMPRAGAGSRGSFQARRAGRFGRNRGVYDITTGMGGRRIR